MKIFKHLNDKKDHVLISGSTISIVAQLVRMIIGFLSVPIILKYYGVESIGIIGLLFSLILITSIISVGVTPALRNQLVTAKLENNLLHYQYLLKVSIGFICIVSLVAIVLSVLAIFVPWYSLLNIDQNSIYYGSINYYMAIVLLTQILMLSLDIVECIYAAEGCLPKLRSYEIIVGISFFIMLIFIARHQLSFIIVLFLISSSIFVARFYALLKLKLLDFLLKNYIKKSFVFFKLNWLSNAQYIIMQLGFSITSMVPFILVSRHLSLVDVSTFSVGYRLISIPIALFLSTIAILWPLFAQAWYTDIKWLKQRLFLICSGIILGGIGVIAGIYFFGSWLIRLWTLGEIIVEPLLLSLFAIWMLIYLLFTVCLTALNAISDFRYGMYWSLILTVVTIMLSSILTEKYGLIGIIVGMLVAKLICGLLPMSIRLHLKIKNAEKLSI